MGAAAEPTLVLRAGRDRSVRRRHPWIFAGAVSEVAGEPAPGDVVAVRSAEGELLARASYEPGGGILARIWTFGDAHGEVAAVDEELVAGRLEAAVAARRPLEARTDAARWVHAESDLLPGLVVDRYGPVAVCHFTSAGAGARRAEVARWLAARPEIATVVERTDRTGRRRAQRAPRPSTCWPGSGRAVRWPSARPPPRPPPRTAPAGGPAVGVRGRRRHRPEDRLLPRPARQPPARGRGWPTVAAVLDLFGYTGGFSVAAAWAGAAAVTTVDSSGPALAAGGGEPGSQRPARGPPGAGRRLHRPPGPPGRGRGVRPDHRGPTEARPRRGRRPPGDAGLQGPELAGVPPPGARRTAAHVLLLGRVPSAELFQKVVFGAALDARVDLQMVGRLGQPADHPVLLSVPETEYLKGSLSPGRLIRRLALAQRASGPRSS